MAFYGQYASKFLDMIVLYQKVRFYIACKY
jgi:hypothetical protein